MLIRSAVAEQLILFRLPSQKIRPSYHRFKWTERCTVLTFSGGTAAEVFKAYLENDLMPHLSSDSILIMDNMRSHSAKAVKALLDTMFNMSIFHRIVQIWTLLKNFSLR